MVDGVGAWDVGSAVLDTTPEPQERSVVPRPPSNGAHRGLVGSVAHVLDPRGLPGLVSRSRAAAEVLMRDELFPAARTSLNDPIGTLRRIETVHRDLDDLKAVKNRLGGTVNDVALAAVTGGLRELLLHRGEEPPARGLRAMVPMNIRSAAEELALGNHVTSLFAHLPVAEPEPLARFERVVTETTRLKTGREAVGTKSVIDFAALAPPVLHATIARTLFATRLFNVTITNVPGPQMPLWGLGSPLDRIYGLVPIAADHALGVAILSYNGRVTFTINADRQSVPDVGVFRSGIEQTLDELGAR
jgi:WS/DGAT/MGAT family acyltransferase